ncbi:uncharacterized protein LOC126765939 [Bactrocera neohumeralis]|uniref:uncharacterized protein LOC126765939 n=1 Tax=Bactrocera neohumeralis TaxID=98809 RepID=UPI0021666349|nr:uncharacterized protein LOC126765939 [Bactrocera neohumeralis]XP_050339628.1 uncharacterized protein LOC126765939 [Bactrocera neohumeralis]XP_050339629.1 uncharacterized protein LOC126765939 [Bactrocera neohumeralis]XP_050339630.1 uncharacterized protein LOC126765939 [Bactrocera neohumeralis]XP_050339631.1 uncharacterized protein LOC126765939 [Bactrocera neohumeralis]XP_050339632.1 uncharacterized protein LOC126765939 [Bactrocera neohumeralis]XP_050339633.1 uncharacterized protein LOC12676
MEKLQFEVGLAADEDPKNNIMIIKSITKEDGITYLVPPGFQAVKHNPQLIKLPEDKKTLQRSGNNRKVWVSMPSDILTLYKDDVGNMMFNDYLLQEMTQVTSRSITDGKLLEILEKLSDKSKVHEEKHNSLNKLNEKFFLKKFENKNTNAKQWLQSFESECARFDLNRDTERITALRLFLNDSENDWYESMLIKHGLNTLWKIWQVSFLKTFADKSWSSVMYALNFKHLNGSLLQYALKKQRLLLEYNSDIDMRTLVDLIVAGLPTYITNKLDRQEMTDPTLLFSALRMYENLNKNIPKHFTETKRFTKPEMENKKRTPCQICYQDGKEK